MLCILGGAEKAAVGSFEGDGQVRAEGHSEGTMLGEVDGRLEGLP